MLQLEATPTSRRGQLSYRALAIARGKRQMAGERDSEPLRERGGQGSVYGAQ